MWAAHLRFKDSKQWANSQASQSKQKASSLVSFSFITKVDPQIFNYIGQKIDLKEQSLFNVVWYLFCQQILRKIIGVRKYFLYHARIWSRSFFVSINVPPTTTAKLAQKLRRIAFSNFLCWFLNSSYFFQFWFWLFNLQEKVGKAFCSKNCTDILLFSLINCSSKLKSRLSAPINRTMFSYSRSEQF